MKGIRNILITAAFLLAAIVLGGNYREAASAEAVKVPADEEGGLIDLLENNTDTEESIHLRDKESLYDTDNEVITMYLTVSRGNASEGTDHTWHQVNDHSVYYYTDNNIDRYKVEGLLQIGTEDGIAPGDVGYGRTAPNVTVNVRGQSSSRSPQKNYKVEFKKNAGSWNEQTTVILNKHPYDGLRFRNKMCFDLMAGIDQMMSLRTNFVHLYVRDLTEGADSGFADYGLYTNVEQLNKTALRAHGLDKNGHLYKVNFFEFFRYEDVIKLKTDPTYDEKKFEEYLEIKGDDDHTKLIEMLERVNDVSQPIDEILDKYFDEENIAYWMAFNILTGNTDTQSRNVYLYSPKNSERWYLLSWDTDASFKNEEKRVLGYDFSESWEKGVSNYWGNVFFQRCLKSEHFRQSLDAAINDLRGYLSEDRMRETVRGYSSIVKDYLYTSPDVKNAPLTPAEYDLVVEELPKMVDDYYRYYLETLETPQPFYIGDPIRTKDGISYNWMPGYDFENRDITYNVTVSRDLNGADIVEEYHGSWTEFQGKDLAPGQYFIKAVAENDEGKKTTAFDYYTLEDSTKMYGIVCFYVMNDGSIVRYEDME